MSRAMSAWWGGWRGRLTAASAGAERLSPSRFEPIDRSLLFVLALLLGVGLVFVYSATVPLADHPRARIGPEHYLVRHLKAMALALVLGWFAFRVPMSTWYRMAPWIFVATMFLLMLVLVPFIGQEAKGARRWISLGVFNMQPTEFMKLAALLYATNYITRKQQHREMIVKGFLPVGFALGVAGALVLAQKDLGGFVVVVICAMLVLYYGGINGRVFAGMIAVFLATATVSILVYSYRFERILAFINPFDPRYERGIAWQLTNSLIAFARGGLAGEGLGQSVEKLFYLPDAHTDFIFAVIGEELGFVGVTLLACAFWWLVWRVFGIGRQALALDRPFSGLLALGIGTWFGVQTLINMGVALGLLPTKGLTLPFLSYGGSSLLVAVWASALVLRIDYENRRLMRGAGTSA
jgi:cell division protein FtsW